MSAFGFTTYESPLSFTSERLKTLLSDHGVILFKGTKLSNDELLEVMSRLGSVQNFIQQQAPISAIDATNHNVIDLHNDDFLGTSRMGWHMDQTFLRNTYLPIRSLYCYQVDDVNITEFADIKYLTDVVIETYPELSPTTIAEYKIGPSFSVRPIFSFCDHVNRLLLRYDSRMNFRSSFDTPLFKKFCEDILNDNAIPKFSVEWQLYDFVIFDNNQSPHRRNCMSGECRLKRTTSKFWLK